MTRASVRTFRWRPNRCPPFVALMNEDADSVIITALKSLPFCCHADLLVMSLDELVSMAEYLNVYLPAVLHIDIRPIRSAIQIRHNIEWIVGYARSAPAAMKVPFLVDSVARQRHSPKTPASPLAMKRSPREMEISTLGRPRSFHLAEQAEQADCSEIVLDSFASRRRTPSRSQAATISGTPKSVQTPRNSSRTCNRPYSSVSSRRSAATANRNAAASSHITPNRSDHSYSPCKHRLHTPVSTSKGKSPRTPTLDMTDMDLLVCNMMSMSVSRPSVSVSVGEFGVME